MACLNVIIIFNIFFRRHPEARTWVLWLVVDSNFMVPRLPHVPCVDVCVPQGGLLHGFRDPILLFSIYFQLQFTREIIAVF